MMSSEQKNEHFGQNRVETHVIELPVEHYPEDVSPERDTLYCVSVNGEILRSRNGIPITNLQRRPLRQLANEIENADALGSYSISLYELCSFQVDNDLLDRNQYSFDNFRAYVSQDSLFEFVLKNRDPRYLSIFGLVYHHLGRLFMGFGNRKWIEFPRDLMDRAEHELPNRSEIVEHLATVIKKYYRGYSVFQRTAFVLVLKEYNSILAAQMVASSEINPGELALLLPLADMATSEVDREEMRKKSTKIQKEAECIRAYLELFPNKLSEIERLIQNGESIKLEFKSTLRWDINAKIDNPDVMGHEIVKTIVAFLNSDGGTLLVGVDDQGAILGTDLDHFANDDKYLIHFTDLIKKRIGKSYIDMIKWELVPVKDKKVLRVLCSKSPKPVFAITGKLEEFFVRTGPTSALLSTKEMLDYSIRRFNP